MPGSWKIHHQYRGNNNVTQWWSLSWFGFISRTCNKSWVRIKILRTFGKASCATAAIQASSSAFLMGNMRASASCTWASRLDTTTLHSGKKRWTREKALAFILRSTLSFPSFQTSEWDISTWTVALFRSGLRSVCVHFNIKCVVLASNCIET